MSVVVPSRDRPDALAACLVALDQQTAASYEVVVVDDASVDTHAVASTVARFPRARLVVADGQRAGRGAQPRCRSRACTGGVLHRRRLPTGSAVARRDRTADGRRAASWRARPGSRTVTRSWPRRRPSPTT